MTNSTPKGRADRFFSESWFHDTTPGAYEQLFAEFETAERAGFRRGQEEMKKRAVTLMTEQAIGFKEFREGSRLILSLSIHDE